MLRSHNIAVEGYTSPEAFLARPPYDGVACMLLDLRMPGLSGLNVQAAMIAKGISMPIIFLSAQSDVPSTVRAMRGGAVDFLEKPVDEEQLLAALERARLESISMRAAAPPTRRRGAARALDQTRARSLRPGGSRSAQQADRSRTGHERKDRQGAPRARHPQARCRFRGRARAAPVYAGESNY